MGYIYQTDYYNVQERIQAQLVQNNFSKFTAAQSEALEIVISHLAQKYDIDSEFTDTLPWNPATTYNIRDRVIIDYALWVASTSYIIGDCIIENGTGYVCATANNDDSFDPSKWDSLGAQYAIYYASFPSSCLYQGNPVSPSLSDPLAPMFDIYKNYYLNDVVYWRGNTWICAQPTCNVRPADLKQYYVIANIPLPNVFPDDAINNNGNVFWKTPTAVVVEAGTLPTDTDSWTTGDNRNPSIVSAMKAITIWILSQTVVSQNVPATWEDRFKSTIESLKAYAEGKRTLRMPLIQPSAGTRVRYGGGIPQQWSY